MTLNRSYFSPQYGMVTTWKYEQCSNKLIWVKTRDGRECLVSRSSLSE